MSEETITLAEAVALTGMSPSDLLRLCHGGPAEFGARDEFGTWRLKAAAVKAEAERQRRPIAPTERKPRPVYHYRAADGPLHASRLVLLASGRITHDGD